MDNQQNQNQQNQQYYQNPNPNQGYAPNGYQQQPYAPKYNPHDRTAEFDAKDISDNKVWALLPYIASILGILVAKICAPNSAFVDFHARQAMKFFVTSWALGLVIAILCWTIIVPIVGVIAMGVLGVVQIITLVQACMGKAVEPVIIRSLPFLK